MTEQLDEALACLKKLEDVRNTMNRLMGPKGVLDEHERYKFLIENGEYDNQNQNQEGQAQAIEAGPAGTGSKMLQNNNEYFYNDRGGNLNQGADDDFWYGDNKDPNERAPLAENEYQSYIANTAQKDTYQGKPGSR